MIFFYKWKCYLDINVEFYDETNNFCYGVFNYYNSSTLNNTSFYKRDIRKSKKI